jgi:hypothetical protein
VTRIGSRRFMSVALAIGVLCGFSASRSTDAVSRSETRARPTRGPDRTLRDEPLVRDLRSSLNELVAQDRFSGAVLLAKNDQGREVIDRAIRNAWSQARVRPPSVVVQDPLPEDASHVTLVQRDHPIQTLAPNRPDQAFAERIA